MSLTKHQYHNEIVALHNRCQVCTHYSWCGQHCPECYSANFNVVDSYSGDIRTSRGIEGVDVTTFECGDCKARFSD